MTWVDGRSNGLWFVSSTRQVPRHIVLHWTGGTREAAGVAETLRSRGLGIHGILETDGTFVQTADFTTRLSHAGPGFNESVGIEIVNPGDVGIPRASRPRIVERIHGKQVTYHGLTNAQKAALPGILSRISRETGIPVRAKPSSGVISGQLARWPGVVGHYQLTEGKNDPGPSVIRAVADMNKTSPWLGPAILGGAAVAALGMWWWSRQ